MNKKPELVLPGGDLKRAKIALDFGADAVYVGLNKYSLRKGEVRFDIPEIGEVVKYAHSLNKKCYVTFNIFGHESHLDKIKLDIKKIAELRPDAFIVADIGILSLAQRLAPQIPVHISTQANVTNSEQVKFYQKLGVKRVVLARELTLEEVKKIHQKVPEMELEVFAHGSMCISYSGRCLLSNYMTGRHANLGDCAQPCRWNYKLKQLPIDQLSIDQLSIDQLSIDQLPITKDQEKTNSKKQILNKNQNSKLETGSKLKTQNSKLFLEELQRKGEYFEMEESKGGTNIISSKDLCTIEYIEKMIEAGISGFKIEGRNKTEYYLASTALAYREAIDLSLKKKYTEKDKKRLKKELEKTAHRGYTSGFLFGNAKKGETYQGRSPIQNWEYVGLIKSSLQGVKQRGNLNRHTIAPNNNPYEVVVKNKIATGMSVEILTPDGIKKDKIIEIIVDNKEVDNISAGATDQTAVVKLKNDYDKNNLIRSKKS